MGKDPDDTALQVFILAMEKYGKPRQPQTTVNLTWLLPGRSERFQYYKELIV